MRHDAYILSNDHVPIPVDFMEWAQWRRNPDNKIVKQETVGDWWISTVFLGIDHNWADDGPPLLFETMVFDHAPGAGSWSDQYMDRYPTWEMALQGHHKAVEMARNGEFHHDKAP